MKKASDDERLGTPCAVVLTLSVLALSLPLQLELISDGRAWSRALAFCYASMKSDIDEYMQLGLVAEQQRNERWPCFSAVACGQDARSQAGDVAGSAYVVFNILRLSDLFWQFFL